MITITVTYEMSWLDYEPWSGARSSWEKVCKAGKAEELWDIIADLFPEGCTETDINDFIWFEDDYYFPLLGLSWEE